MSKPYLKSLFEPRHIALLGVSRDTRKAGYTFLSSLRHGGYSGTVSLLGREDGELEGCCMYSSPESLPENIDLAFNLLSPGQTFAVLPRIAARGAKVAVVFTSGFAEVGAGGAAAQDLLVSNCRDHGMRIVGPNCMGIFNFPHGLNLTEVSDIPKGNIALVSQSGNVGITLWDQARNLDVGFSSFVGFGNQADIPVHEYIEYLGDDPNTHVIALYLEGLRQNGGDEFLNVCSRIARKKPIVALKGGRTTAGIRAAESHTAALSSSARVYSALFDEAGIVEVKHLEHLLPVSEALVRCPPLRGDQIAIVGSGGGHSTVCTDEIESVGLAVPPFSRDLQMELHARLPSWAPVRNPVDMTGAYTKDPSLFSALTELVMMHDTSFDGAINYGLYGPEEHQLPETRPYNYTTAAPLLGQLQAKLGKPIVFYTPYANRPDSAFTAMRASGVPCYGDLLTSATALAALRQRGRYLDRPEEQRERTMPLFGVVSTKVDDDNEIGAYRLLSRFGVQFPEVRLAASVDEAVNAAEEIGYPVVIKAILPGVAHKSDVGGVRTGISGVNAVRAAAIDISNKVRTSLGPQAQKGFLVACDLGRRRELLISVRRDNALASVGVIGLGGVLAEAVDDVTISLLPATPRQVYRALARLAGAQALGEFRGEPPVSIDAISKLLNQLNAALMSDPAIESIECNPALVVDGTVIPVDAVIYRSASDPT